jgi:hypothetical protein
MTLAFAPERIEHWPLSRLQPYAKNAKVHGPDQVAKLAASMAEFGWTVPCLVGEDGELIAGHGRVLAATQLGLNEAPVIVLGHLTEAQRRAYRLADNKLTELGTWDEALLSAELQGLRVAVLTACSPALISAAIMATRSGVMSSFSFMPGANRRSRPSVHCRARARLG